MKARILKGQRKYLNYSEKEESNNLLRRIMKMTKEQNTNRWMKELVQTLKTGMTESGMMNITNDENSQKIKDWDTKEWKTTLSEKESLSIYRNWRTKILNQEKVYGNTNRPCSVLLFKCEQITLTIDYTIFDKTLATIADRRYYI